MKADDVLHALADKHKADVFVPSCKTGPSVRGLSILDAWVMLKSWTHPVSIGYEIKVDRSDFVNDKKWRSYLEFCNEFYFVCPHGLIRVEELPADVGLLWLASTGSRFITKRKAPHRAAQIPEDLYRYILMARAHITNEVIHDKSAYWKNWLQERKVDQALGWHVSEALRKKIDEEIYKAQKRNDELQQRITALESVEALCKELNVDPSSWRVKKEITAKFAQGTILTEDDKRRLHDALALINRVLYAS